MHEPFTISTTRDRPATRRPPEDSLAPLVPDPCACL